MPHVIVKVWPGHTEEQKQLFADAVVDAAVKHLDAEPGWVSVGIEEIPRSAGTRRSSGRRFWQRRTPSTPSATS